MKLLIVDDERHVREAIKILIEWDNFNFEQVFEAAEGQSAIDIINEKQPDIVLTDMLMPILNGVQLLEWIQKHAPQCKTIVISGYDDFTYVRHTIKYGGQDYILKPIDELQLNEAIQKAVDIRNKEIVQEQLQQKRSIRLNMMKPLYWTKMFSSLMEQTTISQTTLKDIEVEFALSEPIERVRVAILPLHNVYYNTLSRFNYNLELLCFSLANICNEFLQKNNMGYAFHNWNAGQDIVLIVWKEHEKLPALLESVNRGIEKTFGHSFDFGVGHTMVFPAGLKHSYKAATYALKKYNTINPNTRIHENIPDEQQVELSLRFDKYQEHIRLALLSEQTTQVEQHVKQWFKELKKYTVITMEQLEFWQQELSLFEARCFENEKSELASQQFSLNGTHFYIPFNEYGQLAFDIWEQQLLKLMKAYSTLIALSNKQISISLEIADYINKNYSDALTLQSIADCFLLSREYISRKFKQDMQENLSDYIAKTRISHAKQLLANPNLKLTQICELVGYQDEKYFSKVFKKLEHVSPSQYRKELLNQ